MCTKISEKNSLLNWRNFSRKFRTKISHQNLVPKSLAKISYQNFVPKFHTKSSRAPCSAQSSRPLLRPPFRASVLGCKSSVMLAQRKISCAPVHDLAFELNLWKENIHAFLLAIWTLMLRKSVVGQMLNKSERKTTVVNWKSSFFFEGLSGGCT